MSHQEKDMQELYEAGVQGPLHEDLQNNIMHQAADTLDSLLRQFRDRLDADRITTIKKAIELLREPPKKYRWWQR